MLTLSPYKAQARTLFGIGLLCLFTVCFMRPALAQVNSYTFTASSGTFDEFDDGTMLFTRPFNTGVAEVQLPAPFWFNGQFHHTAYVSVNGFLTFGQAPTTGNALPISGNEGYTAAIVPFGTDLKHATSGDQRDIRFKVEGSEYVFQWRNVARNLSSNNESISFQARLNTANGHIRYVYKTNVNPNSSTAYLPQMGLRGASNAFPTNVRNRTVANGAETWAAPANGANNNSRMKFSNSSPAKFPTTGQTYTYTPPCFPPSASAYALPPDCNTDTYLIEVDVRDLNGAASVNVGTVEHGIAHGGVGTGLYHLGPFPVGNLVTVQVTRSGPAMCNLNLGQMGQMAGCMENGECYGSEYAIADNGCWSGNWLNVTIPFSGLNDELGSNVRLSFVDMVLSHPRRGDLRILLTSPEGQTRELFMQAPSPASSGADFGYTADCGAAVFTFRDGGTPLSSLSPTDPMVTGVFAPEQPLSGFTGNPNGEWIMRICDASPGASGHLNMVHIRFEQFDCMGVQGGTAWPGSPCDDGNACTENDRWDVTCNCVGDAKPDTDGDGVCDDEDGCPLDPNKTEPGQCGCGEADTDTDGDGVADCIDLCPLDPNKTEPGQCGCGSADPGAACDDGDPATDNDTVQDDCTCRGTFLDCQGVAGGSALPGTPCDDGNPMTINDTWSAGCVCQGTITTCPGEIVELELQTDDYGDQTSWEIISTETSAVVCAGSGYDSNTAVVETCCLPMGCYRLLVYDSFGDGMCCDHGIGGYQLRMADGRRIIDNLTDGAFGTVSTLASEQDFCLPMGTLRLNANHCDRVDRLPADWIQTVTDPEVRAAHGTGDPSQHGYQFWFFDPDGSYTRRVLITHATNNWWFPVGPDQCSYLRLNSIASNPLPQNVELNIRVRSMVNGVYKEFGSACRIMIDVSQTNAPVTQLVDDPDDQKHSCGRSDVLLDAGDRLWAVAYSGVTHYQFRFTAPGYARNVASTGSSLLMTTWASNPLQPGGSYDVQVRMSFDGGANYGAWGPTCTVGIMVPPQAEMRQLEVDELLPNGTLTLWPVPNRGDVLNIVADGLISFNERAEVEIHDMQGRMVLAQVLPVHDGTVRGVIMLNHRLNSGLYLVSITGEHQRVTQRLVVE